MIIPALNAAATLPACLRALDGADVTVVVSASVDGTADLAREHGAHVIELPDRPGPATARNAGLAATTAPLVLFTDADCEPAPGWVAAMTAALAEHDLVQGPVAPVRPPGPFERTISLPEPSPLFETANLGLRREFAAGGFVRLEGGPPVDEAPFGEDALFGWQAVRAGARVGWAPDALVRHAVFPRGPRGYIAEQRRLRYFPVLVRELPELREAFPTRRFLRLRLQRPLRLHLRTNLALAAGKVVGFAALIGGSRR